jgi:hypothetical protein
MISEGRNGKNEEGSGRSLIWGTGGSEGKPQKCLLSSSGFLTEISAETSRRRIMIASHSNHSLGL